MQRLYSTAAELHVFGCQCFIPAGKENAMEQEFKHTKIRHWLACPSCWHAKLCFVMILAGGVLLWKSNIRVPGIGFHLGNVFIFLGTVLLFLTLFIEDEMITCQRRSRRR